jgi:hypothetical protein
MNRKLLLITQLNYAVCEQILVITFWIEQNSQAHRLYFIRSKFEAKESPFDTARLSPDL